MAVCIESEAFVEELGPKGLRDSSSFKDFETKLHTRSPNPVQKSRDCGLAYVHFKNRLYSLLNVHPEIVVTENRSTMLNLLNKNGAFRLSLHKMFLHAPDQVLLAIADYVRGRGRKSKERRQILRCYIQEHLESHDYSHLVAGQTLVQQGEHYHLQQLYDQINQKYFDGNLKLAITWYGAKKRKRGFRVTMGQYLSGLRLIKIHRMLDSALVPEFFIAFVIYHEMVHSVVPGAADRSGRFCFHGREFKKREKDFEHYQQALLWEKQNLNRLLAKNHMAS